MTENHIYKIEIRHHQIEIIVMVTLTGILEAQIETMVLPLEVGNLNNNSEKAWVNQVEQGWLVPKTKKQKE